MLLTQLSINEKAVIKDILGDSDFIKRLQNVGVHVGGNVCILRYAPLLDPMEISVDGILLAIRKESANKIIVEKTK